MLPLVYDELRSLAAAKMAGEPSDHTLQATALVHEAWLRLAGSQCEVSWENRRHFFAAASEAMRRVLIDTARRRGRLKRGGDGERVDIDLSRLPGLGPDTDLLALNPLFLIDSVFIMARLDEIGRDPEVDAEILERYEACRTLPQKNLRRVFWMEWYAGAAGDPPRRSRSCSR